MELSPMQVGLMRLKIKWLHWKATRKLKKVRKLNEESKALVEEVDRLLNEAKKLLDKVSEDT